MPLGLLCWSCDSFYYEQVGTLSQLHCKVLTNPIVVHYHMLGYAISPVIASELSAKVLKRPVCALPGACANTSLPSFK
jgi:hypothetical protein